MDADSSAGKPSGWRLKAGLLIACICLAIACGIRFVVRGLLHSPRRETVTTSLLSPDDTLRASLVEVPRFIDRNFEVRIEGWVGKLRTRTIFRSPDEGRPVGSERFVWSRDGSYLLLVGRHFTVREPAVILKSGDIAYLLYHVPTGRTWCNASQQREHEPFGPAEFAGIDFGEALGLTDDTFNERRATSN